MGESYLFRSVIPAFAGMTAANIGLSSTLLTAEYVSPLLFGYLVNTCPPP